MCELGGDLDAAWAVQRSGRQGTLNRDRCNPAVVPAAVSFVGDTSAGAGSGADHTDVVAATGVAAGREGRRAAVGAVGADVAAAGW